MIRIGFSEDIHPLTSGGPLILGGVQIPFEKHSLGHSDGDVVLHAIAESILGALALGDLGKLFPDNDPKTLGINSMLILNKVVSLMFENGYEINNIDVQVGASKPKLMNYIQQMRLTIANTLKTDIQNVSIKAMSFNGVGPVGEGLAIKASSIVMIRSKKDE